MRLIDADAEIARIKSELKQMNEEIERLEKVKDEELHYDFDTVDGEIETCYIKKIHLEIEMENLENYKTAYDVDKVMERIKDMHFDFQIISANKYNVLKIVESGGIE